MENSNPENEDRLGLLSEALTETVAVFRKLDDNGRARLFQTLATLFGIKSPTAEPSGPTTATFSDPGERFSKEKSLSPKEFLMKKQPLRDVERVACLAYYLGHYRDQPHFKTLDISKLNTEAAQSKLSNAANAVNNATKYGYLAPGTKGMKQLSAGGEMFVEALPDRDAAKAALAHSRPKRGAKRSQKRKKAD
ncbi:MAG: hypothetical protein ABSD61_00950 [Terracidiphilus sp.]